MKPGGLLSLVLLFAVALARGATPAKPPPIEKDGYRIEWTAVSWQGDVNLQGRRKSWEASLSGTLWGPPDRDIVAYVVEMVEVLDAKGHSLLPTEYERRWLEERRQRRKQEQVHRVMGRAVEGGMLGGFEVSLGGGPSGTATIATARGAVYAMEVAEHRSIDLPLESRRKEWRELSEGLKFRVENVEPRGNQFMAVLSHTLDDEAAGGVDLTRPPYLYTATPIDEKGQPVPGLTAGINNRGDGQVIINILSATGQAAKPYALRLKVATAVKERKIDFELTNLDLGLGAQKDRDGGAEKNK